MTRCVIDVQLTVLELHRAPGEGLRTTWRSWNFWSQVDRLIQLSGRRCFGPNATSGGNGSWVFTGESHRKSDLNTDRSNETDHLLENWRCATLSVGD
jgi:hypothetical protein